MVYAAISEADEEYYTYLPRLFESIDNHQLDYNWLITDCFCNIDTPIEVKVDTTGYCWITGEELTDFVKKNHVQWIFAVLSGFKKDIPLECILKYPLPFADGYPGFWHLPLSMQHPLADIEIVPWDSSLLLFYSQRESLVVQFKAGYPNSENLTDYIRRYERS